MSCEQLRAEIREKLDTVPEGSKSYLLACDIALNDGCPSHRSRLTHTSRMLNAQREANMDRIWQRTKQEAETILDSL